MSFIPVIPLSLIEKFVCTPFWYGQISSKKAEFCLYLIDSAIQRILQSDSIIEKERHIVLSLIPTQPNEFRCVPGLRITNYSLPTPCEVLPRAPW